MIEPRDEMDQLEVVRIVLARVAEIDTDGLGYRVVRAREHAETWSVAVQPKAPDGRPTYDYMSFTVDKATGDVRRIV